MRTSAAVEAAEALETGLAAGCLSSQLHPDVGTVESASTFGSLAGASEAVRACRANVTLSGFVKVGAAGNWSFGGIASDGRPQRGASRAIMTGLTRARLSWKAKYVAILT